MTIANTACMLSLSYTQHDFTAYSCRFAVAYTRWHHRQLYNRGRQEQWGWGGGGGNFLHISTQFCHCSCAVKTCLKFVTVSDMPNTAANIRAVWITVEWQPYIQLFLARPQLFQSVFEERCRCYMEDTTSNRWQNFSLRVFNYCHV